MTKLSYVLTEEEDIIISCDYEARENAFRMITERDFTPINRADSMWKTKAASLLRGIEDNSSWPTFDGDEWDYYIGNYPHVTIRKVL